MAAGNKRGGKDAIGTLVSAFESETFAVFARTTPKSEHLVLYVLAVMFVVAVVLVSVVHLDRVVSGAGRVEPVGGAIYVSPLDKAIVREIRVRVGDVVKKGQVLATLDPTFAQADLVQLQQHFASAEAIVAREQAEHGDKPYLPTGSGSYEQLQAAIWRQRQAEYNSSIAGFEAQIKSAEATVAQYRHDMEEYGRRLKVASKLEQMYVTLEKKGFGSKLKTLTVTDTRLEMGRLAADSQNQILATLQTIGSLKAQQAAYKQKWHSDVGKDLVTNRNDLDKTRQDLEKARRLNDLSTLDAPADGVVVKIRKASSGSVASSTGDGTSDEPLFTLQPLNVPLEADIKISTEDIGFIKPGDRVEIKFDAYQFIRHGTGKGVVETISDDSFTTDPATNQSTSPYVRARVSFTDFNLHNVPAGTRLVPGMTLTGDILVGRRTILSYLVGGALRTGSEAMREP